MASKKTAQRGPRRSAEIWRGLIEEWQESGQELTRFCREKQVSASSIRWWRWRLGISADRTDRRSTGISHKAVSAGQDWIELEVETQSSSGTSFELRWPDGMVLAIPADFDSQSLGRLLSVLERSVC